MNRDNLEHSLIQGKTFTLFGNSGSTKKYFVTIRMLADEILEKITDIESAIETISLFSSKKRHLQRLVNTEKNNTLISNIINLINPHLKVYTNNTEEHLKTLPASKFWDRRLATTQEQYHLYMIEIELTNRMFATEFKKAMKKIALLPYCLQDFSVNCKAAKHGFDYQCQYCSFKCYQNHASNILKKHNIEPFIWMGGNMKKLAKYTFKEKQTFAVLGIACIPELLWGMRNCRKNRIPVIGLPLNANRCVRWFGKFYPNSIDLSELEILVSG